MTKSKAKPRPVAAKAPPVPPPPHPNRTAARVYDADLKTLIPDSNNANKGTVRGRGLLSKSISDLGAGRSIVVDRNGKTVAGNKSLEAFSEAGMTNAIIVETDGTRPVVVKRTDWNLDDKKGPARAYAYRDNRVAEIDLEWDAEVLAADLADGVDLSSMFSDAELLGITDDDGTKDGDDDVIEPPAEPMTKLGDLWILGDHRVLCGDSTKTEDVARLMGPDKADLCFTSPPYALGENIKISNSPRAGSGGAYDEHDDDSSSWPSLMDGWWSASIGMVEAWAINVQMLAGNKRELMRWITGRIDRLVDVAIWDKGTPQPAMSAGVMDSRFEWLIFFGKEKSSRRIPLSTFRGQVHNVYEGPQQKDKEFSKIHGATMPIHLPMWVLGTVCDESKSIYEPFCGSGTTLIAAERLRKRCFGMEISPAYVDVIVARWEKVTGKTAHREDRK